MRKTRNLSDLPMIVHIAFASIMVPHLVFALSWGNITLYRATQVVSVILLVISAIRSNRGIVTPSWQALTIVGVVAASTIAAVIDDLWHIAALDLDLVMKTGMLVTLIFSLDQLRHYGFSSFARSALPIALIIVSATAIHFYINPHILFGRFSFFGLHPNLGGEVLFGCMVFLAFSQSRLLRLSVGAIILFLLVLLQSRSGLGAALIVYVGGELLRFLNVTEKRFFYRRIIIAIALSGTVTLISVVMFPKFWILAADAVSEILLLKNPERGLGTGFTGRLETWNDAFASFSNHPFFGTGMDRIPRGAEELAVHNGFLAALAEFGILSSGLFFVLGVAIFTSAKRVSLISVILIACFFIYFFSARSINLNISPLIMWIACLPWVDQLRPCPKSIHYRNMS